MNRELSITAGWGVTHNGMPRRRCTNSRRPAFTLIEVLVTMVLLGIILPVAMRGVSMALAASEYARHTSEASNLAQEKLSEFTTLGLNGAATAGDFSPEHPEYHWNLTVQNRDYGLTELDLQVVWTDRGRDRSLVVSTLVYQTAMGDQL